MNIDIPKILLINKPAGPTSHDIVDEIRRKTGVRRVGHAGTLDPFAQGLLIILVGRESTKQQRQFLEMDKKYDATITLGATSSTDDVTGDITQIVIPNSVKDPDDSENSGIPRFTRDDIDRVVRSFAGSYDQMPPVFSAKKIKGKKAYELARAGKTVELVPKRVMVKSINVLKYSWPTLHIRTTVSSGTYIRALARDIGEKLGCGAYVDTLIRTAIGPYTLDMALDSNNLPNS